MTAGRARQFCRARFFDGVGRPMRFWGRRLCRRPHLDVWYNTAMKKPQNGENLPIRNSTAEFLIFAKEAGADTIAVRFQDEMLWLTLNGVAELFDVDKSVVSRHLSNIYAEKELAETATVAKYATVQKEGSRQVTRNLEYYSLEAIIAVGYRVNSRRATDFRRWATRVLRDLALADRQRLPRPCIETGAETHSDDDGRVGETA